MKVLIVVCVVVLLLQFGVLGLSFGTGGGDEPTPEDIEDGRWDLKRSVTRVENLLDPFRPRLELPWEEKSFTAGGTEEFAFGNGHDDRRVAKFELTAGTGVLIRYECDIRDTEGYTCPQVACLCPAGAALDLRDFMACERFRPDGSRCRADGNVGEIVVYSKTGALEFSGLGAHGGTVRQR